MLKRTVRHGDTLTMGNIKLTLVKCKRSNGSGLKFQLWVECPKEIKIELGRDLTLDLAEETK